MNSLSLLVIQNKSFDPKIMEQGQDLFEKISKAIIKDLNYISYPEQVYPVNRLILQNKGYFVGDGIIYWNDFLSS
jgi:hypothetical protein